MTNDYVPIDCDQHSVLELLAMRQTPVSARVRQGNAAGICIEGVVSDVLTRDGAEYLILLDQTAERRSIRLDRLLSLSSSAGELLWRQKNVSND